MAFAGKITNTNAVVDLFDGIANTGHYTITILPSSSSQAYIGTNSSSSTTGKWNVPVTSTAGSLVFTWDSSTPLYCYFNGSNISLDYVLAPVASVGLAVNCS